jgi:hypothetical protein
MRSQADARSNGEARSTRAANVPARPRHGLRRRARRTRQHRHLAGCTALGTTPEGYHSDHRVWPRRYMHTPATRSTARYCAIAQPSVKQIDGTTARARGVHQLEGSGSLRFETDSSEQEDSLSSLLAKWPRRAGARSGVRVAATPRHVPRSPARTRCREGLAARGRSPIARRAPRRRRRRAGEKRAEDARAGAPPDRAHGWAAPATFSALRPDP